MTSDGDGREEAEIGMEEQGEEDEKVEEEEGLMEGLTLFLVPSQSLSVCLPSIAQYPPPSRILPPKIP